MSAAFSRVDTRKARDEVKSLRQQFDKANVELERHKSKVNSLQERYNAIMNGEIKLDSVARLEKQLVGVDKEYTAIRQRVREIESEQEGLRESLTSKLIRPEEVDTAKAKIKELNIEYRNLERTSQALYAKGEVLRGSLEALSNNPELTDEAIVLSERIAEENAQIDALTNKVDDLSDSFENVGDEAVEAFEKASDGAKKTTTHTKNAGKGMKQFASRLKSIAAGAFVFNVISAGLTGLRKQMSAMLKTNTSITKSFATVKGNLLTAFQPIYEAVLPALQALANILVRVTGYIASFTNMLFGKSVSASAAAAKAMQEQADATKNAAEAANEALGGYDKLNVISKDMAGGNSDSDSIAPIYNTNTESSGLLTNIANAIKNGNPEEIATALGDLIRKGANWMLDTIDSFLNSVNWTKAGTAIGKFLTDTIEYLPELAVKIGTVILDIAKAGVKIATGVGGGINKWLEEKSGIQLSPEDMTVSESLEYFWEDIEEGNWKEYLKELPAAAADVGSAAGELLFQWIWDKSSRKYGKYGVDLKEIYGDNWHDALNKFGENWTTFWDNIKNTFINIWENIKGFFSGIGTFFSGAWEGIKGVFSNVGSWFGGTFGAAGEAIKNGFSTVGTFFGGAWEGIKGVFSNVGSWFGGTFGAAGEAVKNGFSTVGTFFGNTWDNIKGTFAKVGTWFGDKFKGGFTAVKGAFGSAGTFFKNTWGNIKGGFSNVGSWFGEKFRGGFSAIKGAFGNTGSFFKGVWGNISGAFGNVGDWFKNTFSTAWTKVKNVFSSGGRIFSGIKDGILNGLKKVINALITGINKVISVPFNGINAALQKIRDISIFGNHPFSGISTINVPEIPKLATGAVIPPNREFMAVLGDQKRGNNIEAPEALIRQIVREESGGEQTVNLTALLDGEVIYKNTVKLDRKHRKQFGTSQFA
ncbi:MAG: hypothetical protein NC223_05515 [Butyrivibrio sp.]|nr:hypothetical protein [Butyrivibrio sp.]